MVTKGTRSHYARLAMAGALAGAVPGLLGASFPAHARGTGPEILYARSIDGGDSFGNRLNLSNDDGQASTLSHVVAAGGAVHVAWTQGDPGEVAYRASPDAGSSFGAPLDVSDTADSDSTESDLAVQGDQVSVLWAEAYVGDNNQPDPDAGGDEVYARTLVDGGPFGPRRDVSRSKALHTRDPDVAVTPGLFGVAYEEKLSEDDDDVFFIGSLDSGRGWGEPTNLSANPHQQVEPALALDGEAVHVVYEDSGDPNDITDDHIAYARSTDGGLRFADPLTLPSAGVAQRHPAVAVANTRVYVASCSPADKSGLYESELYLTSSSDGGASWSEATNLSTDSGDCTRPTMAADGERVWIAWEDSTPGRSEILLRRSTDGGSTFEPAVNVSQSRGDSEDASLAFDPSNGLLSVTWTDYSLTATLPEATRTGSSLQSVPISAGPGLRAWLSGERRSWRLRK